MVDGSGVPGFCSGVGSGLASVTSDDDCARDRGRGVLVEARPPETFRCHQ